MNATIWTGVDLPLGAENVRVTEIRQDEGGTVVSIEYNSLPVVYGQRRRVGVIHPLPGQLGGGPIEVEETEIKCGRCGHRFLVAQPVSTTVSCPACGLNKP